MLIRCAACNKLIYSDDAPEDGICPACGSSETEYIAMSIVFDQATKHVPLASAPEHGRLPLPSAENMAHDGSSDPLPLHHR